MNQKANNGIQLDNFLPYVLNRLADRVSQELSTIYAKDFGLSIPEWRVIANLAEHDTLNARDIVGLTGMEKSKVSRSVAALDERGLVKQKISKLDNRSRDLALTAKGQRLYETLSPRALDWEQSLVTGLQEKEHKLLMHLLKKLDVRVQELEGSSGGR